LLAVGLVGLGGVGNAIYFQDKPHPAPIFGEARKAAAALPKAAPAEPPTRPKLAVAPTAEKPAEPQRPAAPVQPAADAKKPAQPLRAASEAPPIPPANIPKPAAKPAGDDIGSLIRARVTSPAPAAVPSPAAKTASDADAILRVQRALATRGFDVGTIDGRLGPSTRSAIEKFERQHKLPVTGQVSPRLVQALGVRTASR
jgi:hypothetical protein